jgi:hypothetical protein
MATGEVLEEHFHEYKGPVALCDPGGGSQSSTTQYNFKPWQEYVPPRTGYYYSEILPKLYWKAQNEEGLSPQEKQYYTGQILSRTAGQTAGAKESLRGNLARSGVTGGAAAEAFSNVEREGLKSRVSSLSNLEGLDINKKQQNLDTLAKYLSIPRAPVTSGGTTETSGGGGGT